MQSGNLQYISGTDAEWAAETFNIPFGYFIFNSTTEEWKLGNDTTYALSPKLVYPTRTIKIPNNLTSSSTTRANITDWSFPVINGKLYKIDAILIYQTAATTTGGSLGVILPTGSGSIVGKMSASISASAVATELSVPITAISSSNSLAGSFMTSSGVSAINTPHFFMANLFFVCTATGTFQFQWATEINGSAAQINANSTLTQYS